MQSEHSWRESSMPVLFIHLTQARLHLQKGVANGPASKRCQQDVLACSLPISMFHK